MALTSDLLDIRTIYHEPAVGDYPIGRDILARFPEAERIQVPSHWNIPALHGNEGSVEDWVRIKRSTLVLGVKKGPDHGGPNGRSAHFIAPSTRMAAPWPARIATCRAARASRTRSRCS